MNKYKEFMKAVNDLDDDVKKKHCYTLLAQARIYCGTYQQYKKWRKNIWNVIEQHFTFDDAEKIAKQKETEVWDIFERFVMYMYYTEKKCGFDDCYNQQKKEFDEYLSVEKEILKEYGIENKKTFSFLEFLNTVFRDATKLESDLEVEKELSEDKMLIEKKVDMIRNTFNKWKIFRENFSSEKGFTKYQLINMEKLEKAVQTYKEMNINEIDLSEYSIEECFNEVYSEEQVKMLIDIIKNQPALIHMHLTPMINELTGDRSLVKGTFANYENKLRLWKISEYKEKCQDPIDKFKNVMDELVKRYDIYNCITE